MNKRLYMMLAVCLVLCSTRSIAAAPSIPMLEDAIYSILFPQMNAALEKHYGKQKKYDCPKIVVMKKLYSGTYVFQASIEVITYEQKQGGEPEAPFERVTIAFGNEEGEWAVQSTKAELLPDNTKLNCRKPV